jgi:hypothetical protein
MAFHERETCHPAYTLSPPGARPIPARSTEGCNSIKPIDIIDIIKARTPLIRGNGFSRAGRDLWAQLVDVIEHERPTGHSGTLQARKRCY